MPSHTLAIQYGGPDKLKYEAWVANETIGSNFGNSIQVDPATVYGQVRTGCDF